MADITIKEVILTSRERASMTDTQSALPTCNGLRAFNKFAGHGACTCYGDSLIRNERERIVASIRTDAAKQIKEGKALKKFGLDQNYGLLAEILDTVARAVEDGSL